MFAEWLINPEGDPGAGRADFDINAAAKTLAHVLGRDPDVKACTGLPMGAFRIGVAIAANSSLFRAPLAAFFEKKTPARVGSAPPYRTRGFDGVSGSSSRNCFDLAAWLGHDRVSVLWLSKPPPPLSSVLVLDIPDSGWVS
jgi:hypothetical protein